MKTSKTLFFLLGALLAALLTWWLAGDKQAAAGTSAVGMPAAGISAAGLPAAGERSALDVIATRTSVRAYRDCPVGGEKQSREPESRNKALVPRPPAKSAGKASLPAARGQQCEIP